MKQKSKILQAQYLKSPEDWLPHIDLESKEHKEKFVKLSNDYDIPRALDEMRTLLLEEYFDIMKAKNDSREYKRELTELKEYLEKTWDNQYYWKGHRRFFSRMSSHKHSIYLVLSWILNQKITNKQRDDIDQLANLIKEISRKLFKDNSEEVLKKIITFHIRNEPIEGTESEDAMYVIISHLLEDIRNSQESLLYIPFMYFLSPNTFKDPDTSKDFDQFYFQNEEDRLIDSFRKKHPGFPSYTPLTKHDKRRLRKESAIKLNDFLVKYKIRFSGKIYLPMIKILNLYYYGILQVDILWPETPQGVESIKKLIQRNKSN
ncbi:hypothetical protein ACFL6I_12305 [candidate division KSB1 bacterium]